MVIKNNSETDNAKYDLTNESSVLGTSCTSLKASKYEPGTIGSQTMFQSSSAAWQNLLHATLALRLKLLMLIVSSLYKSAKSSFPFAIAPTKTQILSRGPRSCT